MNVQKHKKANELQSHTHTHTHTQSANAHQNGGGEREGPARTFQQTPATTTTTFVCMMIEPSYSFAFHLHELWLHRHYNSHPWKFVMNVVYTGFLAHLNSCVFSPVSVRTDDKQRLRPTTKWHTGRHTAPTHTMEETTRRDDDDHKFYYF